jgi:hypothetical protein
MAKMALLTHTIIYAEKIAWYDPESLAGKKIIYAEKDDPNIGFQDNRQFFRPKRQNRRK